MAGGSCCVGLWSLTIWCIAQWLERLTADQQVPGSNPGVPSCVRISSPQPRPRTCTHIVLTHTVPAVCGMRSQTSLPACMPARSTFSPDNAPADCPRLDYAVASRAASHVGLCKRIPFVCSVLLWCKYNSMRDFRCLYSSVIERQSCKLNARGSIRRGAVAYSASRGKPLKLIHKHNSCKTMRTPGVEPGSQA